MNALELLSKHAGKSEEPTTEPPAHNDGDHGELGEILGTIPCVLLSRDEWRDVSDGFKAAGGDFAVWDAWCQTDPDRYDEAENQRQWESFNGSHTSGTVIHFAEVYGGYDRHHRRRDTPPEEFVTVTVTEPMQDAEPEPMPEPDFRDERGRIVPHLLAQHLIDACYFRFIDGAPAIWTGTRWAFGTDATASVAYGLADDLRTANLKECLSYLAHSPKVQHVESTTAFDGKVYVAFRNATVEVHPDWTRVVKPQPSMLVTNTISCDYRPDTPDGVAHDFLQAVTGGRLDLVKNLEEVAGACMTASGVVQQSPLLVGRGGPEGRKTASNGKSTYIEALRSMLGSENVTAIDPTSISERFQARNLTGKLAALSDDLERNVLSSKNSIFKKLITSEPIYTDVKFATGYDFRPYATQVISMNGVPKLDTADDGLMRRVHIVPFVMRFTPGTKGYDPSMGRKLSTEAAKSELANIGIKGLQRLLRQAEYTHVEGTTHEISLIQRESSSVSEWIAERNIGPRDFEGKTTADVYPLYRQWCQNTGAKPVSNSWFIRRINEDVSMQQQLNGQYISTEVCTGNVRRYVLVTA